MLIDMDDKSKEWLESKGNVLTVKVIDVKACCAPGVQEVVAIPGKPKPQEGYHEFKIDHLSIYVQKMICQRNQLTLKLSGFSFLKSISAKVK